MITFTPEFIAEQREKAKKLESPVYGDKIHFLIEYYNGKAYLKAGFVNLASFTLGSHDVAKYLADALNHYPAALDEIDALTKDLAAARAQRDYLEAENKRLQDLLHSAVHALRSYQYGNGSPDLAEEVADRIEREAGK